MNQKEIPIDIDIYNKIYEHLSAKDWRLAEDLLTTMTNKSINPNPDTMNAFLKGYTKLDNLNQGFSMVQACFNQYGVKPSKTVFLQALETYLEVKSYIPFLSPYQITILRLVIVFDASFFFFFFFF